jgi:hypothetical protein
MQSVNSESSPLSVVIPTTARRRTIFLTINSILKERDVGNELSIEVVINPLNSNKEIVNQLLAMSGITIRFHDKPYETAEASAMWAAYTSSAEWVWLIGDDDIAMPGSVPHIKDLIKEKRVDFWLLNLLCTFDQVPIQYYRVGPRPIQIGTAFDLWQKCGFFSILTTISSFLIKREILDMNMFEEFHDIQGIYSHSVSLLAMLKNSQVGMTDYFCINRNEENAEDIFASMQSYIDAREIDDMHIWTTGAWSLLNHLAEKIDYPIGELLNFREIEIIRDPRNSYLKSNDMSVLVSSSGALMARHVSDSRALKNFFDISWLNQEMSKPHLIFSAPVRVTIQN